ncbi:MAG: hypothetical protein HYS75_03055, partial [Nitrosopumilales archaeon]|nr:hypothetical protein [Nitrosopumilales archaeon]
MTEAIPPAIKTGGLDEGVNKEKKPKITVGNPTISKIIPRVFPCSSISIITHSTPNFPLTNSFNTKIIKVKQMKINHILLLLPIAGIVGLSIFYSMLWSWCVEAGESECSDAFIDPMVMAQIMFVIFYGIPVGIYFLIRGKKNKE